MAHFAKLDENNVVLEVHVVHDNELIDENGVQQEQKGIEFLINWSGGYQHWKQTSRDGRLRKNFAVLGGVYDVQRDAFIQPKPYASWSLNEETCQWVPPVARPNDGAFYYWDEDKVCWLSNEPGNVI